MWIQPGFNVILTLTKPFYETVTLYSHSSVIVTLTTLIYGNVTQYNVTLVLEYYPNLANL
jgi:hypothetical protein